MVKTPLNNMKNKLYKISFFVLFGFLTLAKGNAQCDWKIYWGMDCSSPIIAVQGCGSTSSVTVFTCNSPTDPDCACNDVPVYKDKTVGGIEPLCSCDCSNVRVLLNGVPYSNGALICCGNQSDPCLPCKCGVIVIDCNNKTIKFTDPC